MKERIRPESRLEALFEVLDFFRNGGPEVPDVSEYTENCLRELWNLYDDVKKGKVNINPIASDLYGIREFEAHGILFIVSKYGDDVEPTVYRVLDEEMYKKWSNSQDCTPPYLLPFLEMLTRTN